MGYILFFLFLLLIYALPMAAFIFLLRALGAAKRRVIFISFSLLGLTLGLLSALSLNYKELMFNLNMPGMILGESIYVFAINHLGDPHSAFAHYTIPWILRIPQLYLLTTAAVWGLAGTVIQLVYNLARKPPAVKSVATLAVAASLVACLSLSLGALYTTQDSRAKYGPTEPSAVPVIEISLPPLTPGATRPEPPVTYDNQTTYQVQSLALSRSSVRVGEPIEVSSMITNTGSQEGMAEVGLKVDDKTISSRSVPLLAGESQAVRFLLTIPREGSYTVSMGGLSQDLEVEEP